jgi:4-aminobutyrate aminotransferase-like enzyme
VLALAGGPEGKVVQLAPPLSITDEQLRFALARFEDALSAPRAVG